MKKRFYQLGKQFLSLSVVIACTLLFSNQVSAQGVSINGTGTGTAPDADAILDLDVSGLGATAKKGFLAPRVALANTTDVTSFGGSINAGAVSLLIYNTTNGGGLTPGFYYWTGLAWQPVGSGGSGTVSGTASLANGKIWIGDGSNIAQEQTMSSDVAITNAGVATIQDNAVDGTDISISGELNGNFMEFDGTNWIISPLINGNIGTSLVSITGDLDISSTISSGSNGVDGEIFLYSEQGVSDYSVTITPSNTTTSNYVLTLPPDDGNANQVLQTDGAGALSWVTASSLMQNLTALGGGGLVLSPASYNGSATATVGISTGGVTTTSILDGTVSNTDLATMPANTIKGNNTGGVTAPLDLTATQTTAMLDVFTSALKGLAPASGGGTTNFLRADGTWAAAGSTYLAGTGLTLTGTTFSLTSPVAINLGGTGISTAPSAAGEYLRSSGAGVWAINTGVPWTDITGAPAIPTAANPTASVILTAVNGSATTYMRSDAAPALSQAIIPTWTGVHTFSGTPLGTDEAQIVVANATDNGSAAITFNENATFNAAKIHHEGTHSGGYLEIEDYSPSWTTTGLVIKQGSVGIGTLAPASLFSVGASNQFQVNSSGNLIKIDNVTYDWPNANAAGVLVSDVSGNLSWSTSGSLTTNTLVNNGTNTLTSTVNGIADSDPIVNTVSNSVTTNSLVTTVNGIASTVVNVITSNALTLNGSNQLVSTVNGLGATPLALPGSFSGFANPTASLGLTAVNGSATTAMRSDAAPALDVTIAPTWSGIHTFSNATPIRISNGTLAAPSIAFTSSTGTGIYRVAADELGIAAAGVQGMRVTSSGVGIMGGTPDATNALRVNGKVRSNGVNESSDERLKKNFENIDGALSKVLLMNGKYYDWRVSEFPKMNFSETRQVGVIAQEMEKILPEVVATDSEGYKSVEYSHIVPVLIEAIKEQQKIIDGQNSTITDLKASLENVLNRVNIIEKNSDINSSKVEK